MLNEQPIRALLDAVAATVIALDKAEGMSALQRLRLTKELASIRADLSAAPSAMQRLRLAARLAEVRKLLGMAAAAVQAAAPAPAAVADPAGSELDQEPMAAPRESTARFFDYDDNRKPAQRRSENRVAMDLLRRIDSGEIDASRLTEDQRAALAKYSGLGGNLVGADGKKGSAYEYYTPKPIAEGMWTMLSELGFAGGRVLDPSSGTGVFGATAPVNAAVDAIELNATSGRVNQLVNGGPGYSVTVSPFEAVASATPDEAYDAVVTNVPFGDTHARGDNRFRDTKYRDEPLENYFILRSLEKLRPGGLAAFITPPRCVSARGGREQSMRQAASYQAEFLGAYRLPNKVFGTAAADTITDVIVFRKYSRDVLEKIQELKEQSPSTLVDANVLWQEFIEGDYFRGEGRRFVIGTMEKAKGQWGEKDVLNSDLSVADIAKLLRKFPGSRVDWEKLNAAETAPIIYLDGDTMRHAGDTLEMRDGRWVRIATIDHDSGLSEQIAKLTTPLGAVNSRTDYASAIRASDAMVESARALEVPDWLRGVLSALSKLPQGDRPGAWNAAVTGLAIDQAMQERLGEEEGFDFLSGYPTLSEYMQTFAADAKRPAAVLPTDLKTAMKKVGIHYSKESGYSGFWRGDVAQAEDLRSADQKFAAEKYAAGGGAFVSLESAKKVYGESFDPIADDAWCISADGSQVASADDYFTGNYGDFLAKIDAEIASAEDARIKAKLLRQKLEAEARVQRLDVSSINFNLFSPFTTLEQRVEFLRRYVDRRFVVAFDEESGKPRIICDIPSPDNEHERNLKRLGEYLRTGTVSTRTSKKDKEASPDLERQRIAALRALINRCDAQFNAWAKANPAIVGKLNQVANDPARLYFRQVEDSSALTIPGINPDWIRKVHGYQNAWVRKVGREFSGILGDGVGLGKAQPLDARILTPDGWKRMGDMRVGDLVFAADGFPAPVVGVYPQGEREIFEVEFTDGSRTRCCDEHMWFTRTENDRKNQLNSDRAGAGRSYPGSVKPLSEIRATLLKGRKQKNHQIPMVRPVQYPERTFAVHPYLLGVLLGDGSMSGHSITFTKNDRELADRVCNLLRDGFGDEVALIERNVGDRADTWGVSSPAPGRRNPVLDEVGRLGLMGTHSHTKFIPDGYLRGSVGQRIELLRGLMDTDGYVSKDGVTVQYYSTSPMLASGMVELVQSLGGNAWTTTKVPTYTYKGEKRTGRMSYTVGMRLPPDINPFHLARKQERVRPKSKYLPTRYIVNVRSVGVQQAQCIAIDHPSHLYVTDDHIVTHNTSQSLLAVQHAQSIGAKRRTCIVVPNAVLSNWRKEAGRVYAATDDCLYVGLREKKGGGGFKTDPAAYDVDLNRILEGRHRKVFMTYEAFQRLRLRESTAKAYDTYLARVDKTYRESDENKKNEKAKSLRAEVIERLTSDGDKSLAAPFFEDLGFDSLVFDEGHMLKNSRATVEFKGGKFLSLADPSNRGLDAQAKAWVVRGTSPRKDGVIVLTATPVTNSPLEVYSMLSLAVGDERLNDMVIGIQGADDFMDAVCTMENRDEETLDGQIKPYDVFIGLKNVDVLRGALTAVATIRTAEQVGAQIVMPDSEEKAVSVALPESVKATLQEYKLAFRFAIDTLMEKKDIGGDPKAFERVQQRFGEPIELIGHPFNLINKMTSLIADPELDSRATFWIVSQPDLAQKVVAKWNAKAPIEERARPGPMTPAGAVVGTKTIKEAGNEVELVRVKVTATIDGDRVVLDSLDPDIQGKFEALAEKDGLDLDVTVPPKLAAMLENFRNEEANPRGIVGGAATGRVRQLIFCDTLALHSKIKRLLVKRAGVAPGSIAIITGKINGKPEQIQEVQDGFNAEGEANRYRVVIANEKAEVGINLQKGTQAIHHLTLGWTPDSLTQRNGRGARQGNETERVTIYHYDADGTFDSYKRMLVGTKSSWIDALVSPEGGNTVEVSGGLTRQQLEALIDSVGDADAMTKIQERAKLAERIAREASTQGKQVVQLTTIADHEKFLKRYQTAKSWAADKVAEYFAMGAQIQALADRIANPKASASAVVKNEGMKAELTARRDGLRRLIDEALIFTFDYGPEKGKPATVDDLIKSATRYVKRGDKPADMVADAVLNGRFDVSVEAKEDSSIGNEWRSEVDQARAMIEESERDFSALSGQAGGYPKDVLAKARSGGAVIIDGKIVCVDAFVRKDDQLGVVFSDRGAMMVRFVGVADGRQTGTRVALADALKNARIALPGSPDYDADVNAAAAIEDQISASGGVSSTAAAHLFSSSIPQVAERRKAPMLISYPARGYGSYTLPSPYFPVVIDTAAKAPLLRRIAAEQASVVKATSGSGSGMRFSVESSVAVNSGQKDVWPALVSYAKANGLKITRSDFEEMNDGMHAGRWQVLRDASIAYPISLVESTRTEEEALAAVRSWFESAYAQYEFSSDTEYTADPVKNLSLYSTAQAAGLQRHLDRLRAPAPDLSKPAPAAPEGPSSWGYMTGDTYGFNKERSIRAMAAEGGFQVGFLGKNGALGDDAAVVRNYPRAAVNSWVMTRECFDFIVGKTPSLAARHRLTFRA